jgi:hypothetical protein
VIGASVNHEAANPETRSGESEPPQWSANWTARPEERESYRNGQSQTDRRLPQPSRPSRCGDEQNREGGDKG